MGEEAPAKKYDRPGRPPLGEGRDSRLQCWIRPELEKWIKNMAKRVDVGEGVIVDAVMGDCTHLTTAEVERLVQKRKERNVCRPI